MADADGSGIGGALRKGGRGSLLLLAALLPFEMTRPLARLGPLQLSSVELFLYLALAIWAASVAAGLLVAGRARDRATGGRRLPAAHAAVLIWTLVLFASALCAPVLRGTAFKFALRSLSGILLYAAAVDLLRDPAAITRVARALAAGAISAALLTLAEGRWARVTTALRPFHGQTFEVFGLLRGSGPFQYPNIAAMYLEAVLPLVFVLGLSSIVAWSARSGAGASRSPGAGAVWPFLVLLALLVLLGGILTTASRAGLATAVACLVALGICLARAPVTRRSTWAALGALAVLALGSLLASPALNLRLHFWKDADWYRASLVPVAGPAGQMPTRLLPAGQMSMTFEARNLGVLTWHRLPPAAVALSYHWIDADSGEVAVFDGARSQLPTDVAPGGSAIVRAIAVAPTRPGRYLLWWDLVHEHATWFGERGNPGLRGTIEVGRMGDGAEKAAGASNIGVGLTPRETIPRAALWRAALAAWREHPLLGLGADNFRHLYGRYLGLRDPDDRLHANNLYLETLADQGTLGFLALAFLVGALGLCARRAAAPPSTRLLALGLSVGLGAYLVHGLFDTFLEFTPTFALPWLLAGMLVALGRPPREPAA
jgi:O-Antigen ligase